MNIAQANKDRGDMLKYKEALLEICYPVKYMQKEAKEQGCQLSPIAYSLSNDPAYLKSIAAKALDINL